MLTPQELDGTPIEFDKAGNPVIPEGYMSAPTEIRNFEGFAFKKGGTEWEFGDNWAGNVDGYFYIIPDPNYKKEEQPTPVADPILAAFDGAIKDLQEELQDMKTAKEVYLRMSKDAEVFNTLAEKYGWYEEEEQQEVDQVPEPTELKVGDKVRIRLDAKNTPPHNDTGWFSDGMEKFLGKIVVIEAVSTPGWFVAEGWAWSSNWLEKVKEEP